MNPRSRRFQIRPCRVCQFAWSDAHHLQGRKNDPHGVALLSLCPNHHRLAHQLIAYALAGTPTEAAVWDWGNTRFELLFMARAAEKVLAALGIDWAEREALATPEVSKPSTDNSL